MKYTLLDTVRDADRLKLLLLRAGKPMRLIEIIESLGWEDNNTNRSRAYAALSAMGDGYRNPERGKYSYVPTDADEVFASAILGLQPGMIPKWQSAEQKLEDMDFAWSEKHHLWLKAQ